ncbi:hypothetical protein PG995_006777 [Apiospora arundinis]|uniref:Uncharacterized protein n=1 Tax=Apiospora arundinis TaxID=335852 RepID=A0ABR2JJL4_9PEZI
MQFSTILATVFAAVAVSATGLDARDDSDLAARHDEKANANSAMDPKMAGMDMSGSKKNMTMGGGSGSGSGGAKPAKGGAGALSPALVGVLGAVGLAALGQSL